MVQVLSKIAEMVTGSQSRQKAKTANECLDELDKVVDMLKKDDNKNEIVETKRRPNGKYPS